MKLGNICRNFHHIERYRDWSTKIPNTTYISIIETNVLKERDKLLMQPEEEIYVKIEQSCCLIQRRLSDSHREKLQKERKLTEIHLARLTNDIQAEDDTTR